MNSDRDLADALANMDEISSAIGPGGDPDLDDDETDEGAPLRTKTGRVLTNADVAALAAEAEAGYLVVPAARLQAAWDRLLAETAETKRARTTRRGLTITGYAEADMYAHLAGFPADDGFGGSVAVHRALEAGRPTPLLPEDVPADDETGGE